MTGGLLDCGISHNLSDLPLIGPQIFSYSIMKVIGLKEKKKAHQNNQLIDYVMPWPFWIC